LNEQFVLIIVICTQPPNFHSALTLGPT